MVKTIKENYKFLLFILVIGIISGICMFFYAPSMLDEAMLLEVIKVMGSVEIYGLISFIQVFSYACIFGILGIYFSKKVNLLKSFEFKKNSFIKAILIGFIGGMIITLLDKFVFMPLIPQITITKPTLLYMLMAFTYGGVIEEVMMRLFLMSVVSFILWKIFDRKNNISNKYYLISNILCALLFAAGHLPATILLFGGLTPAIVIRCFIGNGILGFMFGEIYRKDGIIYAMVAHIFAHVGMQALVLLFI